MNGNKLDEQAFEELLSRHFDGELSAEESQLLTARVRADPASMRRFALFSLLHDQIRTVLSSDLAKESIEADSPNGIVVSKHPLCKVRAWKFTASVAALAAVILIGVRLWPRSPETRVIPAMSVRLAAPVAVLNVEIAARWSDPNVELLLRRGDLPDGPLGLESGTAEFTFASGATAVVQGPAFFEPLARDRLAVTAGRVIGRCLSKEAGLTIVTPSAQVTDLGTEFGVVVGEDHHMQVRVIRGEVELVAAKQSRRLKTGQTAAVDEQGRPQEPAPIIEDFAALARIISDSGEMEQAEQNRLIDPGMTLSPQTTSSATAPSVSAPWRGTPGHVDLMHGLAHSGDTAVRIRALGNPMWPLVAQDVKTGPIDGRVVVASAWATHPSDDPLSDRQNAIVKIVFLDTAGREFAQAERNFLRADATPNRWMFGQIAALAPPGTVALRFQLLLNARGEKTGTILVDDAKLQIISSDGRSGVAEIRRQQI